MSTINRISAWILAACFIAFMITGLDVQLRFLNPVITSLLHLNYLFIIAQISFMFHSTYSFYRSMIKRNHWNLPGKIFLGLYLAFNGAVIVLFLVIHL